MIIKKIRRRCACGCGEITNYGKRYVYGHHWRGKKHSAKTRRKMSEAAQNMSDEHKRKLSEAKQNMSDETKLNISLAKIQFDPDNPYCDVWKDINYRDDIRKDYCENVDCNKDYKRLCNHHIHLNKKRCAPNDIITLCMSCHMILHRKLECGKNKPANPKDYIIINRPDHVSYIHKESHEIIRVNKIIK